MMCKARTVTTRGDKNEKDPNHMALLLDCKEQLKVIEFDPETVFDLSTEKSVWIPKKYCLFYKECLTMTLQDKEHNEEGNVVGIRPFTVLTPFLGESMLKADSWTPFECMKIVKQAVYSRT